MTKLFLSVLLVAIVATVADYFLPWWTTGVVCFLVALTVRQGAGRAFLMGFFGVACAWLVAATLHDLANAHLLSARMAELFHLPGYSWFILVTVLIGALVGGLSSLTGNLLGAGTLKTSVS